MPALRPTMCMVCMGIPCRFPCLLTAAYEATRQQFNIKQCHNHEKERWGSDGIGRLVDYMLIDLTDQKISDRSLYKKNIGNANKAEACNNK